ncbi:glycosyl transferase [Dyadobacter beijingensis]|uniref:Glycosyl transferase n=1 Tax=Dyadobacter beijingensis TaxID=365489 RepID=A0ABQ2IJP7_9BACT|nr:glycosyltransferase [Dyadobacter beijingensis]GGN14347.1 glycosyl transferase [Dyadobacter beijingensis]
MKRVLLLSTVHPPTDSRIMYKIAPSLARHYHVSCALPGLNASDWPAFQAIQLPKFERLVSRLLFAHPVVLFKCLRLRPDIVHIFVPELLPVAFIFQWLGTRVIYEVQENLFKKFEIKKYNNHLIFRKLFIFFDKLARRRFHCIFTDDAYLAEYKALAKPFSVIHNYVSLPVIDALAHTREHARVPEFFYLGVVSPERCLDTMIAAMALLKTRLSAFHLHLFGPVRISTEDLEQIEGYAAVKDHLTFHGYTDLKTALRRAGRAVAGIALLKPVADYPESFPTKLFEYMALKLPVITSDFPLYRPVVDNAACGFCISPDDPSALCEKLEQLINNPQLRNRMGGNGRNAAEMTYNWASEEARLLSFYNDMLCHDTAHAGSVTL